jgi:uncharacterized membrane protein
MVEDSSPPSSALPPAEPASNPDQAQLLEDPRVRAVEIMISTILRTGVLASLALVVAGTVLSFAHHPAYFSSPAELQRLTHADGFFPHTLGAIIAGTGHLQGESLIMLGLLLLIATPVVRVAASIFAFIYQRDRIFVLITCTVLILLLASFFLGKTGG